MLGRGSGADPKEARIVFAASRPGATTRGTPLTSRGLSRRQIERLFRRHLDCVPKRYYLEMRLRRARELLLQTAMPIMDVTTSCGFKSPPHFSRCYRAQFGYPPSEERRTRR